MRVGRHVVVDARAALTAERSFAAGAAGRARFAHGVMAVDRTAALPSVINALYANVDAAARQVMAAILATILATDGAFEHRLAVGAEVIVAAIT